jgi:hypothetical protein
MEGEGVPCCSVASCVGMGVLDRVPRRSLATFHARHTSVLARERKPRRPVMKIMSVTLLA